MRCKDVNVYVPSHNRPECTTWAQLQPLGEGVWATFSRFDSLTCKNMTRRAILYCIFVSIFIHGILCDKPAILTAKVTALGATIAT